MGNGMIVYVTLPGFKKEPIFCATDETFANFCRKVYDKTGVALFNGFGFIGKNGTAGAEVTYVVPTVARIVNKTPDVYAAVSADVTAMNDHVFTSPGAGALSVVAKDISTTIIDSDAGTLTTLAGMSITHGMELVFFTMSGDTPAKQQASEFDANS